MDPEMTASGEVLLYTTEDGRTRVECRFEDETIWLSQALMAELFQTSTQNINLHLRSIYEDGEASEEATCKNYLQVQIEGEREVRRSLKHYNLDAILAVGYRVRSPRGTQFRRWATERLREYLVKGFVMDDERLRNPPVNGSGVPDYFDELLERIRDIRASERRMYLRVKEIFAMAADYVPSTPQTNAFFATMQNKLHYAVTGLTAAEMITQRANAGSPNMGLNTWKGTAVAKSDVTVAKNYLREGEIGELNRIVVMWLDFAEDQAPVASRCSCAIGRHAWTTSCGSTTATCWTIPAPSPEPKPMNTPAPSTSGSRSGAAGCWKRRVSAPRWRPSKAPRAG
jgi:hypothetical protein